MQDEELKEKIRDGSYFQDARKWYSVVYMSLISERIFYIILTSVALLTMFIAVLAVMSLMPLSPTIPLFIKSNDVLRNMPRITPLAQEREEPNAAIRRFYVAAYVRNREDYSKNKVNEFVRFIFNNSDGKTYEVFKRYYDATNPRSPIVVYGAVGTRTIQPQHVVVSLVTPAEPGKPAIYNATVYFDALVSTYSTQETTSWRADLTFEYQDLAVEQDTKKTRETGLKIAPMQFKVTSYTISAVKG